MPDDSGSVIQLLARLGNGSLVQQVEKIDRQFGLSLRPLRRPLGLRGYSEGHSSLTDKSDLEW